MHTLWLLAVISGVLFLSSLLAVYLYGQFARRSLGQHSYALPVADEQGELDHFIRPLTAAHPDKSGLLMLDDNIDAFAVRALSARTAVRSLDLQYYYWKNDTTGSLLAYEILHAAERGVRVRLLLDDINIRRQQPSILSLDAHPNIEIRLFNPSKNRPGSWRRGIEMLLRAFSVTRRMHNKAWIADGRLAIVGGRNIGDAYFSASAAANFRDLDLLAIGSLVPQAETVFDRYWNSSVVIPAARLRRRRKPRLQKLIKFLEQKADAAQDSPYLERAIQQTIENLLQLNQNLRWTAQAKIIADPPEKAYGDGEEQWLLSTLQQAMSQARRQLHIISPYFIPGDKGTAQLCALAASGTDVAVLTNSLAATDVTAVHGAYMNYRQTLLRGNIRLYELKGKLDKKAISLFGAALSSDGASLHTKAFYTDHQGFIGSFNFDPRSVSLNTEMGVIFSEPELIATLQRIFTEDTTSDSSYRLGLQQGRLYWRYKDNGKPKRCYHEPKASIRRKLAARIISWLPVESQL
ncbi:phospholipase D family protein [Chromatiaceae bacterium AAb-1]|nr:phospholipase D family protein [Chromatiaceae bacterium AAb-1]